MGTPSAIPSSSPPMTISTSMASIRRRGAPIGLRRRPDQQALGDEQQRDGAADRNRQIGNPDGQERKLGDNLLPGRRDEAGAPDTPEQADQPHPPFPPHGREAPPP